jgi:hypothetical protein
MRLQSLCHHHITGTRKWQIYKKKDWVIWTDYTGVAQGLLGACTTNGHGCFTFTPEVLAQVIRVVHANAIAVHCAHCRVADTRHILCVHLVARGAHQLHRRRLLGRERHVHLGRLRSVRSQVCPSLGFGRTGNFNFSQRGGLLWNRQVLRG